VVEQVADAELSAVGNPKLVATAGEPLTDVVVATFIDENPAPTLSDYTASIAWGDGTISEGTITPDGTGGFNVTGTHTYAAAGIFNTLLAIVDDGGSSASADGVVTVSPVAVAIPNAPKLIAQDDTGISHTDGITKNNGSVSAPLSFTVSGVSPPTSFVQLYQVTLGGQVAVGSPVQASGGTATITLAGGANLPFPDGIFKFAASASATSGGSQTGLSGVTTITIQTSLTLTTNPVQNASVSALPDDQLGMPAVTLTFSHPLAGLTAGQSALGAADAGAITLTPAGGAPLAISTVYEINTDGTSTIVITPAAAPTAAVLTLHVTLASFADLAGNVATGPAGGNFTFTVTGPPSAPVTINPIAAQTVEAPNGTVSAQVTTTDPDLGRTLVYSLSSGAPAGASINASTGVFNWTPTVAQGGSTYSIAINVAVAGMPTVTNSRIMSVTVTLPPPAVVERVFTQQIKNKKKSVEVIEVQFNQAMNAADANSIASYSLVTVPANKKQKSTALALASASYNPATFTVTLTTKKALVLNPPVQLTVKAGSLLDSYGRPLDGGTNSVAVLSKSGVKVTSAVPLVRSRALHIDALFARGDGRPFWMTERAQRTRPISGSIL
jgi:hypothetical protein